MPSNKRFFSEIIAAVKPQQRTDQYVILAALYHLTSETTPATVEDINRLLKLHLRAKAPRNVANSLRKYTRFVSPVENSRPLRWHLLPDGTERLAKLSKLNLAPHQNSSAFESDIGIVCALEQPEFEAVQLAFGGQAKWAEVGNTRYTHLYRTTALETSAGKSLKVIATASTSMGLTAAAIATTQLIMQFKPRIVVMIGIAAGTRSGGKEFGDVLVADPSVDYNSGKVVDSGGIREFLPDPYPLGINARLRSVLLRHARDNQTFSKIRRDWRGKLPAKDNRLHIGPLGAADQVIDDHSRILEITKNWRKLVGVEMETYAVYRACHESPEPKPRFVSFKSVCDFAAEKTDSWQQYAAFVAAQFSVNFFKQEWEALWPNEE